MLIRPDIKLLVTNLIAMDSLNRQKSNVLNLLMQSKLLGSSLNGAGKLGWLEYIVVERLSAPEVTGARKCGERLKQR